MLIICIFYLLFITFYYVTFPTLLLSFCFRLGTNIMGFDCEYITVMSFHVSTFCYGDTVFQEGTLRC